MAESKTYPKIERSKKEKMIFFPDNIVEVQKEFEPGESETFYHYDLVKIPDKGQDISDYDKFKEENYDELRKNAYGTWREQLEILQEQGIDAFVEHCVTVKEKYPK